MEGLSQRQLAEKVGLSHQRIAQYEAGEGTPSLKTARKLADALRVTIDLLYPEGEA
jgi:transcriptional regulator with XRE-family HTH domain